MTAPDPICGRCSKPMVPGLGSTMSAALIEQASGSAAAWLATIVESSDDAIIGKRLDGTIVLWNGAAERLYGYSADEAIGRPLSMLLPPDRPNELSQLLERVQRGERIRGYETQRLRPDGIRVEVSLTILPVRDAAGDIVGASALVHDLTEYRARVEALAAQRAQEEAERADVARTEGAEETNSLRDEFLAKLSHELRSPLNAIAGWLNVLHAKKGDPAVLGRATDVIERNVRLLAILIDDLLAEPSRPRVPVQVKAPASPSGFHF